MTPALEKLITDYLDEVERCLRLFDQKFGRRDIIRARREHAIPRVGTLDDEIGYNIHGFGCTVEFPKHDVDFDFYSQFDVGFDAWRLWQYATEFPGRYPSLQQRSAVETQIADAVAAGRVHRVKAPYEGEGNGSLMALANA